jgi:outer membrane protein assembly factor BamD
MHKLNKIGKALCLTTLLSLTACSSQPDVTAENESNDIIKPKRTALTMYKAAKRSMNDGLYNRAIQLFNELDSLFPFGPMSKQIQLDLIYAYYKSLKNAQAVASIDRFIRLNPNDKDLDYVYFMRGLVNMGSDENLFQDMFGIDRADKSLEQAREGFQNFKTLLEKFPESKYAADSRKRMTYLLDKMARSEIYVAKYYMKQGAYLAAANRGQYVIENYPNSPRVENALEVMIESYDQLGLDDMKNDSITVMKLNYPDNQSY